MSHYGCVHKCNFIKGKVKLFLHDCSVQCFTAEVNHLSSTLLYEIKHEPSGKQVEELFITADVMYLINVDDLYPIND